MPAPTSVPELIDRLRKSKLVPADRLEGFLAALQTGGGARTPEALLERLVAAGMITRFHATKLAAGKYKGFQLGEDRYLILDQLGEGGMGQVFLAEHTPMRRLVALKVLPPHAFENDPVARERFFREARAAGTLDHPNIVRVFDLCQEGKILYLVMEYVEGLSLQALVTKCGPLPVAAACHYIRQVAFGLGHAHELGFVHRDIKPANLILEGARLRSWCGSRSKTRCRSTGCARMCRRTWLVSFTACCRSARPTGPPMPRRCSTHWPRSTSRRCLLPTPRFCRRPHPVWLRPAEHRPGRPHRGRPVRRPRSSWPLCEPGGRRGRFAKPAARPTPIP
jgi:hypothetical protein